MPVGLIDMIYLVPALCSASLLSPHPIAGPIPKSYPTITGATVDLAFSAQTIMQITRILFLPLASTHAGVPGHSFPVCLTGN